MSTASEYASFCASLSVDDLPDDVVEYARDLVTDTVGVAIGAERVESTEPIREATRSLAGDGAATVLATGERMDPREAAFVNAAMAHSLDYDDSHRASGVHPGSTVIPSALAAGEAVDAAGSDVLAGIVAGYEVACRLGAAVDPSGSHFDRGFHVTATCGLFGATAAIGVVRGLDEVALEAAFGVNGSQASGSVQYLTNGGWNKRIHPGMAARSGFEAVALAENGFYAAERPIDGDDGFLASYTSDSRPELTTDGLGEEHELTKTALKPYPCCRFEHMPIDLLLELTSEEPIDPAAVERIDVHIPGPGVRMLGDPANPLPKSFVDAQFNMPFATAMVLTESSASLDTFLRVVEEEFSPAIERLVDVTEVSETAWIEEAFPEALPGEVVVETETDTYSARGEYPRGEPENRLSPEELRAKFDRLATPVLGDRLAASLHDHVRGLDEVPSGDLLEPLD